VDSSCYYVVTKYCLLTIQNKKDKGVINGL